MKLLIPGILCWSVLTVGIAQTLHPVEDADRPSVDKGAVDPGRPRPEGSPGAKSEKRAKGPTEITAREATFDNRTSEAAFLGEVVVKDPEFSVTCERMSVYLRKPAEKRAVTPIGKDEPEGGSGIDKAVAEINVVISQLKKDANGKVQRYVGRGTKAVFDNATGNVTLSGWPQIEENVGGLLSKKIASLEERCVIIINRAGKIDVTGLHKTTLQDSGAFEQNQR